MPPKSKKKKSKAALEAEQKAQEEEEERLRVEEEEKERRRKLQRAEEEAQEKSRQERQQEIFREDEEAMSKMKCERHQRFYDETKLIENEREWQDFLTCDNTFGSINDVASLNCFLFENRIADCNGAKTSSIDLCKYGSEVGCIMTNLIVERLYLKSISQLNNDSETKSREFLSECFDLLQAKLNIVTANYLKQKRNGLLTADSGISSHFGIELHVAKQESDEQSTFKGRTILPIGEFSVLPRNGCGIRVLSIPFYTFNETCFIKDPLIIGNTLYKVDVLELPPEPKRFETWVINSCQTCNDNDSNASNDTKVECRLQIPDFVVPSNLLTIMRQDDNAEWSVEGVSDVRFNFEQNNVFFSLSKGKNILAITRPRTEDLSYNQWSIGPAKEPCNIDALHKKLFPGKINAVKLSLETSRFQVEIQVIGTSCYLIQPELYQLKDLIREPHSPEKLLSLLSQRGIHLVQSESDSNFATKRLEIEDRFCEDISLLCSAFDMRSSPHNSDLDRSKAMYGIKESDIFTGGRDIFPMYEMLMEYEQNNDMVSCSIINSHSSSYQENERFSSLHPLFALENFCSPETLERVNTSSPTLTLTMKRLLKLLNPISCSCSSHKYGL